MKDLEPAWPIIIKHLGEDELTYIHDQAEWKDTITSSTFDLDETDLLIDSSGKTFSIIHKENNDTDLQPGEEIKNLQDILGLVKAHAAQAGSCCVAKLSAPSIEYAFNIVKSINND